MHFSTSLALFPLLLTSYSSALVISKRSNQFGWVRAVPRGDDFDGLDATTGDPGDDSTGTVTGVGEGDTGDAGDGGYPSQAPAASSAAAASEASAIIPQTPMNAPSATAQMLTVASSGATTAATPTPSMAASTASTSASGSTASLSGSGSSSASSPPTTVSGTATITLSSSTTTTSSTPTPTVSQIINTAGTLQINVTMIPEECSQECANAYYRIGNCNSLPSTCMDLCDYTTYTETTDCLNCAEYHYTNGINELMANQMLADIANMCAQGGQPVLQTGELTVSPIYSTVTWASFKTDFAQPTPSSLTPPPSTPTAVHDHVSTTGGAALTASLTGWTILLGLGLSVGLIFV